MPRLNPFAAGRTRLTRVWEADVGDHVLALAWLSGPGLVAAASAGGPIDLLDGAAGVLRQRLPGHANGTSALAVSRTGEHFASSGQDGKVRLWDVSTGRPTQEMAGGAAWVERVAWCPTADLLASAAGKKLRLWSPAAEMVREYPDHARTVVDIAWKPGEATLASTAYGSVSLWSPEQQAAVRAVEWKVPLLALAWSPDGRYLAAGGQDACVRFWVLESGEDLQMAGYPSKVRDLAWDPTGRYLATGGAAVICAWDCGGAGPAGTEPRQLEGHKALVSALAYQHRGALLASGGEDGQVALWQPGRQQGPLALARAGAPVAQVRWSADDRLLAVGTAEGKVILFAHG